MVSPSAARNKCEAGPQLSLGGLKKKALTLHVSTGLLLFTTREHGISDDLAFMLEAINQAAEDEQAVIHEVLVSSIIKFQPRLWSLRRQVAK